MDTTDAPPPIPDDAPRLGEDGVDVSLIRWMLSMSAQERLRTLQAQSDALTALRDAAGQR
ncbi:MAG: hypothetical protein AAGB93_16670 [Planctomycetota bacterium]